MLCKTCQIDMRSIQTMMFSGAGHIATCVNGHANKLTFAEYGCLSMDIASLPLRISNIFTSPQQHTYDVQSMDRTKRVEPVKRYDCQQCEYATESFRAINNVPQKAHLCRYCYNLVSEEVQKHYKELVDEPPIALGSGAAIEPNRIIDLEFRPFSFSVKI